LEAAAAAAASTRMVLEVGVGFYHSSYFQKYYKPKAINLFYFTMARDTTKGRVEDYSKIGIEALSRNLTKSRSIVSLKFKADADFFCPDNKGREWLSAAGTEGGGKASIVILRSSNEEDAIPIVRWHSYIGQDGLNCRILSGLPIHRGSAGEFFFKSASTTSNGVSRKTVFALKFSNKMDADEFHMWWLHFSGQIHAWTEAAKQDQDPTFFLSNY